LPLILEPGDQLGRLPLGTAAAAFVIGGRVRAEPQLMSPTPSVVASRVPICSWINSQHEGRRVVGRRRPQ